MLYPQPEASIGATELGSHESIEKLKDEMDALAFDAATLESRNEELTEKNASLVAHTKYLEETLRNLQETLSILSALAGQASTALRT
jgi:FtsZ-binding cell division protein ZapB